MVQVRFCVECGGDAGLGHLRRMIVLADALREMGLCCDFALTDPESAPVVTAQGWKTSWWDQEDRRIADGCAAIVLDGYSYSPRLLDDLRGRAVRVVVDDTGDRPVEAELVLNHNLYGADCDYSRYRSKSVLQGPAFTLVGREFEVLRMRQRPEPAHYLISFGGTDDGRLALPVVRALRQRQPAVPVDVALIRRSDAAVRSLQELGASVHVRRPLEALMGEARVYIGGGGVSIVEARVAGVHVVACALSENQRLNVQAASRIGIVAFSQFDPEALAMAAESAFGTQAAPAPTDGRGRERVAAAILKLVNQDALLELGSANG